MTFNTAEQVSAELQARLAQIRTANGSETDLGASVLAGVRRVSDDMIPCVVVVEGDDVPSSTPGPSTNVRLSQHYALLAYVPCDPLNPNLAARAAIRDLKRAVFRTAGRPDANWGRQVQKVDYLGRDIGTRDDGASFVLAVVEIAVQFAEDLGNP